MMMRIIPGPRLQSQIEEQVVPVELSIANLAGAVADCQAVWWEHVIEGRSLITEIMNGGLKPTRYAYHRESKRPVSESIFRERILPKLAEAGDKLFVSIFRPNTRAYAKTKKVGGILRDLALQTPDLRILIRSDTFRAPWNFLYLGNPRDPRIDDFLGYRHLVEHDLADAPLMESAMAATPLKLAVHVDENIDRDAASTHFAAVADFLALLDKYDIGRQKRNYRQTFLDALRAGASENIFYFLCHGVAGDDTKANSDRVALYLTQSSGVAIEAIDPGDIQASLDRSGPLEGRPLVFINACRAMKSGSVYYDGFAKQFLNNEARSVLGPEIEMPVVFARDFAKRFFEEFFRGGTTKSVGRVLLELRREYLSEYLNPLGLAYSLYRGSDLHLSVGLVPRSGITN
jgi:hypothetical protein